MTHDYKRHVPSPCSPPWISWKARSSGAACSAPSTRNYPLLNAVERQVPADKAIHVVLDNYAFGRFDGDEEAQSG